MVPADRQLYAIDFRVNNNEKQMKRKLLGKWTTLIFLRASVSFLIVQANILLTSTYVKGRLGLFLVFWIFFFFVFLQT